MLVDSVNPCTKYLTFGPWIYLVPPYKPKSVLILGYVGETVAGLIRLLYGDDVYIVGVDIEPCEAKYGVQFVQADAKEFVKTFKGKFDTVVVDLFKDNKVCDFVNTTEFVENLKRIANYILVDAVEPADMTAFADLELVGIHRPPRLNNEIYCYQVNKIPDLCIE